jgi:hypothetical protein
MEQLLQHMTELQASLCTCQIVSAWNSIEMSCGAALHGLAVGEENCSGMNDLTERSSEAEAR